MKDADALNKATREFIEALDTFNRNTGVDVESTTDILDTMVENLINDIPESKK